MINHCLDICLKYQGVVKHNPNVMLRQDISERNSNNREFKIYDATVRKKSLKMASSILSIVMSFCLTFESWRKYPGTEFRGVVSTLEKNIRICAWVFTFSVNLRNGHFTSQICRELERNARDYKKHVKGVQNLCFCQLSMQILWRRRCSRVVDLKLPNKLRSGPRIDPWGISQSEK